MLICPVHFLLKPKYSPQDPRFPDCLGRWPRVEPAFCLSIWREACRAQEQESWVALEPMHLPACLPRQESCPTAKAGHLAVSLEQGAPRQLAGCGSRAALCSRSPAPKEQEAGRGRVGGHPLWALPWSWAAPEPGSWETARLAW